MAIWRNAFVQITPGDSGASNQQDVSEECRQVELRLSRAEVDATTVGDDHEVVEAGLPSGSLALTIKQDYSTIDDLLFDIYNSDSGRCRVEVRPSSANRASANPAYFGVWSLVGFDAVAARPGALHESPITLRPYSKIQRLTSG